MNGLSIGKAKRYDKAIERARKLKEDPQGVFYEYSPKERDTICDYIFPELKESEDGLTWLTRYIEEEAYILLKNRTTAIKVKPTMEGKYLLGTHNSWSFIKERSGG